MTLRWQYTPYFVNSRLTCTLLKCALLKGSRLTPSLVMSALLPLSAAHAEDFMQVNVLVFAQPEHSVSFELWRPADEMRLEYPLQRVDFKGLQVERDERFSDFGLIMSDRIARAAQRLQASDYRVLLQQSWTQPVLPPDQSFAIVLAGGQSFGDHQELEGYVTIYHSEQRIRMGTHLWLSSAGNANNTPAPAYPVEPLPELGQSTNSASNNSVSNSTAMPSASQVVMLNDTRILNEGALHYIDHPRFGVLIEILPPGGAAASETETTDNEGIPSEEAGNDATEENNSEAEETSESGEAENGSEAAE